MLWTTKGKNKENKSHAQRQAETITGNLDGEMLAYFNNDNRLNQKRRNEIKRTGGNIRKDKNIYGKKLVESKVHGLLKTKGKREKR